MAHDEALGAAVAHHHHGLGCFIGVEETFDLADLGIVGDLIWPLGQIAYGRGAFEAVHGLVGAGHDGQAHVIGRRGWRRRRPAEKIALAEMRAQADEAGQLGFGLDTLGHNAAADFFGKGQHGFQKRPFDRVGVDAAHQGHVDLHEIGLDLGDGGQAGIAGAHVVHGHAVAGVAVVGQGAVKEVEVLDAVAFGDLQHHVARLHAVLVQELSGLARGEGRVEHGAGMDVAKKPGPFLAGRESADGRLAAGLFQGEHCGGLLGEIEQHGRRGKDALSRPPGQGLPGEHRAASQVDDGLIDRPHPAEFEDLAEFALHGRSAFAGLAAGQPGGLGQGRGQGHVQAARAAEHQGRAAAQLHLLAGQAHGLDPKPPPYLQAQSRRGALQGVESRAVAADHKERPAGVQAFDQADRQR